MNDDYSRLFNNPWEKLKENIIYRITDIFGCCYIFMILPDTEEKSALIAGPYINSEITHQQLIETAKNYGLSSEDLSQLIKYFGNLSVINDERYLQTLCNTLGETIWKGAENFSVEKIINDTLEFSTSNVNFSKFKSEDSLLSIHVIEERYEAENRMMQAVSQGKLHFVEQLFSNATMLSFEKRTNDPVRNMKNYLIISNTLLRKAAERGSVHPFYIDGISTDFAKKIEQINSVTDANELMREMVKKYCMLVKNHSMKNYSLFVQKVITIIDSDLTADLSLKKFAQMLSVNPSYLSSLFKKETGNTLTEYVTNKRIQHAEFLLKTTKLQIQTIAQQCGVYDVNYFTKTFKKVIGKTPKEYRNDM